MDNQRYVGVDVCKDHIVCWVLDERPKHLKQYWRENFKTRSRDPVEDELTFYITTTGIDGFLKLQPTAIAMEPTGYHYSEFLSRVCAAENIPVHWVGHAEVNHYRRGHRLPDKNDLADALALAAYLWENAGKAEFFLDFAPGPPRKLRELYLKLQTLNRMQSPHINRLRQELAIDFPEVALTQSGNGTTKIPPLIGWLADSDSIPITKRAQTLYDRKWENSVARRYGGSISPFTRKLAQQLCDLYLWEDALEKDMTRILDAHCFERYRDVLDKFGIRTRTQALVISQIYPLSKFDSIGGFKKRLGCAGEEDSSGDKFGFRNTAGSKLLRTAMYLWILTTIAPRRCRPTTAQAQKLGQYYDKQKAKLYGGKTEMKRRGVDSKLSASVKQLERMLNQELTPLVKKDGLEPFQQTMGLVVQMISTTLANNLADPITDSANEAEIKRGFGNLIIMRTAGYACKLLFKELKRSLNQP